MQPDQVGCESDADKVAQYFKVRLRARKQLKSAG